MTTQLLLLWVDSPILSAALSSSVESLISVDRFKWLKAAAYILRFWCVRPTTVTKQSYKSEASIMSVIVRISPYMTEQTTDTYLALTEACIPPRSSFCSACMVVVHRQQHDRAMRIFHPTLEE